MTQWRKQRAREDLLDLPLRIDTRRAFVVQPGPHSCWYSAHVGVFAAAVALPISDAILGRRIGRLGSHRSDFEAFLGESRAMNLGPDDPKRPP